MIPLSSSISKVRVGTEELDVLSFLVEGLKLSISFDLRFKDSGSAVVEIVGRDEDMDSEGILMEGGVGMGRWLGINGRLT